jgi:hypothetical protein
MGGDRDPGSQRRLEASITSQYQLRSRALASQLRTDDEAKIFFPVQVSGKWARLHPRDE